MNQRAKIETVVFLGLIAAGVAVRLLLRPWPNVAPIAAIALFSGYYFRSRWTALAVPFCMMAITDHFIGGYQWKIMIVVYAMLTLPVAARTILRRSFDLSPEKTEGKVKAVCGLLTCSLTASILFYVVTNFAVWFVPSGNLMSYPPTLAGLVTCYVSAWPFLQYTLASDLFFGVTLFGGYAFLLRFAEATEPNESATWDAV